MRFVVVYQREPHARQMAFENVEQPKNRAERVVLARRTLAELSLDVEVWIDDQGDQSRALFGDLPNSAVVIDPTGVIHLKLPWCDPAIVDAALPQVPALAPGKAQAREEAHFLRRVESDGVKMPEHHRYTMLAHLATSEPTHADAPRWLDELANHGPEHQRAWARAQMQHTLLVDAAEQDAIAAAVTEGKLLLYSFAGYNCASCRLMEQVALAAPDVRRAMRAHLVELRLHTDAQNGLSDERFAANLALQQRVAKTKAIPYYVVVDPANGAIVDTFALSGRYDEWLGKWLQFVADVAAKTGRARSGGNR